MRIIISLVLAFSLLTGGCDNKSLTEKKNIQPAQTEETRLSLDLATPDKALKSYWGVRDRIRRDQQLLSEKYLQQYRDVERALSEVTESPLTKRLQFDLGILETYTRDIVEVKVESESRAVIIANIKNSSPIPSGATVTKFDQEIRENGEKFRYVLEKTSSVWRVAEIWAWETYPSPRWKKRHPSDDGPYVPSLTYRGL